MKIQTIRSRWVLDSRGDPTIEVDVILKSGAVGRASVPAGLSIGQAEARELRDGVHHFGGKGVSVALNAIEFVIKPALLHCEADHQELIDARLIALDGTKDKHVLGANTMLAVSFAVAKAVARARSVPLYRHLAQLADNKNLALPIPMINVINGGMHAQGSIDVEECLIIPVGAKNIHTAIRMSTEIFHVLGVSLARYGYATGLGDEGGFAPWGMRTTAEALEAIVDATRAAGYKPGLDVALGLNIAASQLYHGQTYQFTQEKKQRSPKGMNLWYGALLKKYPIVSIEDLFDQEAWMDWQHFTQQNSGLQIVGGDLVATNERRLHRAIRLGASNTLIIKPNQIGTLTEAIHAAQIAKRSGWNIIVASRSGETEDIAIVHLAVGLGAGQIKIGAVARGEHTAKYNELLRIAESMKTDQLAPVWH